MEQQLSDVVSRLRRLESKREQPAPEVVQASGGISLFSGPITLVSGTATADVDWTDSGSRQYLSESAKMAIIWGGTTDNCSGTGLNLLKVRGNGAELTVCEQRGTTTSDTQNNMSQVWVPVSNGRFDFSIDLDGANNFKYRIDLVGYVS